MKPLRLHISPCPNDTFMFDALINGRIDTHPLRFNVEYHDIEELNSDALAAKADISKISCAILPTIAHHYTLLDSGAALGRGNGPLLVRPKGTTHPLRRIAVPGLHTTASALITRLLPQIEEQCPMLFSQIAQSVESREFDGGVLIHEGRFLLQERNLELVADLGLLWEQETSLPLPLGAIVVRSSLDEPLRRDVERLIRQSVQFALDHPTLSRPFIKEHAQELDDHIIDQHIKLFVNQFSLTLGSEGHAAVAELQSNQKGKNLI